MYPDKTVYLVQYNRVTDGYSFYRENNPANNPKDLTLVTQQDIASYSSYPRFFVIQFYDPEPNSTNPVDPYNVARISILNKAYEIKKVIEKIKEITNPTGGVTNATSVNIIAHSMGGLDARAYVENMASVGACYDYSGNYPVYYLNNCNPGASGATYANDVANIITIDTPHAGSPLAKQATLSLLANDADLVTQCEAYGSTNMMELLPRSNGGLGLIEMLNYDGSINPNATPSVNSVPIQAVQDYFTSPTQSWIPDPLNPGSVLPGESDDIVAKDSQSIESNLSIWNSSAPLIGSIAPRQDYPQGYPITDSVVASISDCWAGPYVTSLLHFSWGMLHNMTCLGALPATQSQILAQLQNDNMLWINSWSETPSAISVNDPVTIGYSAVDSGSTTLSSVTLWKATADNNGQPGAWSNFGTQTLSGVTIDSANKY